MKVGERKELRSEKTFSRFQMKVEQVGVGVGVVATQNR
jgi:hypothetical protein